jgi:hypothetical protein
METIVGIYGVIGDLGILVITFGIMIGIVHMAERLGITFNLRQGTYHDVKFHKQDHKQTQRPRVATPRGRSEYTPRTPQRIQRNTTPTSTTRTNLLRQDLNNDQLNQQEHNPPLMLFNELTQDVDLLKEDVNNNIYIKIHLQWITST